VLVPDRPRLQQHHDSWGNEFTSSNLGFAFQGDVTRIGGTFWNLSGYYRGRFTKQPAAQQQTLQDLINHTYHLSLTYDNRCPSWCGSRSPVSTLGFESGHDRWRLFRISPEAGNHNRSLRRFDTRSDFLELRSQPRDQRQFREFEGGDYEHFHYSSTSGGGISMINWAVDRPLCSSRTRFPGAGE